MLANLSCESGKCDETRPLSLTDSPSCSDRFLLFKTRKGGVDVEYTENLKLGTTTSGHMKTTVARVVTKSRG